MQEEQAILRDTDPVVFRLAPDQEVLRRYNISHSDKAAVCVYRIPVNTNPFPYDIYTHHHGTSEPIIIGGRWHVSALYPPEDQAIFGHPSSAT